MSAYSGTASAMDNLSSTVANKYVMLNELGEVPGAVLDMRVCMFLNKYPEMIEYLIITDQYVGFKNQYNEDGTTPAATDSTSTPTPENGTQSGLPKSRSMLLLCLNVAGKGLGTNTEDMENMQPAFQLAMHLIDKAPRIRLSKEAKQKAIKKRKDVAEQFMKSTHKQRQEAAMLRKEEKIRAQKEKIMNESDPEKQRKLEEKQLKAEKKKQIKSMKQIKIKSM
jgi:hypothetical protein